MSGSKVYPMTFEQESVWLDEHLSGEPSRYLESWAYRLHGAVDADAAQWALSRIVDRHECLRSRLTILDDRLVQVVEPVHETTLEHLDLGENDLDKELRRLTRRPLDLDVSPLRAGLLHITPTESVLLVQFHHAVVDRWSFEILDAEFTRLYSARVAGRPAELPPVSPQLGEYALTQRAADLDPLAVDYWRERLHDIPVPLAPLADRPPPARPSSRSGTYHFTIAPEVGRQIHGLARTARTTPFTVFTAALSALSCGYLGADETVIGTPVSRRRDDDLDGMIGCLTDLVPLRCPVPARQQFAGLVAETRTTVLGAMTHGTLSYSQIMARTGVRRRLRNAPLCPTVLGLDDDSVRRLDLPEVRAERIEVHPHGKGALQLDLAVDKDGYDAVLKYDPDRYDPPTVGRIAEDLCAVLGTAVAHPDWETAEILSSNGVN
ncbi:condensation domain-containing protein [Streptomyces hokutonensis]|uniref:Condensation domain-containing protein n=1 Tax=Streptomyces hokutonensis TaxID=1306990 RepID=A0ABW6M8K3_9ACTN